MSEKLLLELYERIAILEEKVLALEKTTFFEHIAKPIEKNTREIKGRYRYLSEYLLNSGKDILVLKFAEIEEIIQSKLPQSCREHRALWANTESHSIALAWMNVGYRTVDVNMDNEQIKFEKIIKMENKKMELIATVEDILENIKCFSDSLSSDNLVERKHAVDLVKNGRCFFAVDNWITGYSFYPSRFIGYKKNSITAHQCNPEKDGRETNPEITKILSAKGIKFVYKELFPQEWERCEELYKKYCEKIGCEPSLYENRKYWI